jgi:4'-phosphopantetheinyl transferase
VTTTARVEVWLARPADLARPELVERWERWLTDDEATRRRALLREVNRQEFLVTRALVRATLSRHRPITPHAWRFAKNPYGRPRVEPPCGLVFNLSNTIHLVACAVREGGEIGVDIEPLDRSEDVLEVADTVFSPRELAELRALADPMARRERALDLWTLKESYIKARGMGLSLPLEKFSFVFDDPAAIRIAIDPSLHDPDDRWSFRRLDVAGHRLALAVEQPPDRPLEVHVHDATADLIAG